MPMISEPLEYHVRNKRSCTRLKDACFRYRAAVEGEKEGGGVYTPQKVFIEQIRASN